MHSKFCPLLTQPPPPLPSYHNSKHKRQYHFIVDSVLWLFFGWLLFNHQSVMRQCYFHDTTINPTERKWQLETDHWSLSMWYSSTWSVPEPGKSLLSIDPQNNIILISPCRGIRDSIGMKYIFQHNNRVSKWFKMATKTVPIGLITMYRGRAVTLLQTTI